MIGEEHKLKTKDSLSSKLIKDAEREGKVTTEYIDDAANHIHDSLRYTYITDAEHYFESVDLTLKALEKRGYKVIKFGNYWGEKSKYQGVNVKLEKTNEEGSIIFELQFHTLDSFIAKDNLTHNVYGIERNIFLPEIDRDIASSIQINYQKTIDKPNNYNDYTYQ